MANRGRDKTYTNHTTSRNIGELWRSGKRCPTPLYHTTSRNIGELWHTGQRLALVGDHTTSRNIGELWRGDCRIYNFWIIPHQEI